MAEKIVPLTSTVVVVDDELVRAVVVGYLEDCGLDVVEAENADEALAALSCFWRKQLADAKCFAMSVRGNASGVNLSGDETIGGIGQPH